MTQNTNRAARFYFEKSKDIYDPTYKTLYDIPSKQFVRPVFNYVRPAVNTLTNLSLKADLKIIDQDEITKTLNDNNFQSMKYDLMIDMIIYEKAVLYVEKQPDGVIEISRAHPNDISIIKSAGKIINLVSNGKRYDSVGKETDNRREYYVDGLGDWYYKDNSGEPVYSGKYLPFAIFETNYDIDNMIDIIDNLNVHQYCLNNTIIMHGNAILHLEASAGTLDTSKSIDTNNGYMIFESPNVMKFIEMNGNVARINQDDKEKLTKTLFEQYPECNLAALSSGSNISEQTMLIKFSDIIAKVTMLRSEFTAGLKQVCNIINYLSGKSPVASIEIDYGKILPEAADADLEAKIVAILTQYKELGNFQAFNEYRKRMLQPELTEQEFNALMSGL